MGNTTALFGTVMHTKSFASVCVLLTLCTVGALVTPGCASRGRAMSLSRSIAEAAARLSHTADPAASATVTCLPRKRATGRFSLVLFPDRPTTREDLIAAGLLPGQADRIFHDLAYLDIGTYSTLVLLIPGEPLTFTTHWTRYAAADRILVAADVEECDLLLSKAQKGVAITQLRAHAGPGPRE